MNNVHEVIQVCIPQTGMDYYDYLAASFSPELGARVKVSFRRQTRMGVVVGFSSTSRFQNKLKPILEVMNEAPLISHAMLDFYRWVARYYHATLSDVLLLALPKLFRDGKALPALNVVPSGLQNASKPNLHPEQEHAVITILKQLHGFNCFMLQGITGSGKTEVYLRVIESVLAEKKQVLVLVPEIGLTPQLVSRFKDRLSVSIGVMHSYFNDTERYQVWSAAARGQISLLLGTRSALFVPLPQLGLIVVDEEHDASFKQQDGVRYSARDCALIRAKEGNMPVILGSATPSLESYHNIQQGRYQHLTLTRKALTEMPLKYELVDLRQQQIVDGLAPRTYAKIESHLNAGHQVLVFVNRRGFAPVLLCHACGWTAVCTACERNYTVHQKTARLICHHCGRQEHLKSNCGSCENTTLLSLGVGTQRLYQALSKRFPHISTSQIDRDELSKKNALEQALEGIASGQIQLMVGTQLIAKGHHFPKLTLVVIVDADSGLYNPDFRALEKLGQLLLQVSGRAGRAALPGEVLIQTHMPEHPLLSLLIQQGYDQFAQALLHQRQQAQLPPFMHIGLVRAKGRNNAEVASFLQQVKTHLASSQVRIYGPAPSPMPKKAGLYRMQLCLMSANRPQLHQAMLKIKSGNMKGVGVKWSLDIDPVDLA